MTQLIASDCKEENYVISIETDAQITSQVY